MHGVTCLPVGRPAPPGLLCPLHHVVCTPLQMHQACSWGIANCICTALLLFAPCLVAENNTIETQLNISEHNRWLKHMLLPAQEAVAAKQGQKRPGGRGQHESKVGVSDV